MSATSDFQGGIYVSRDNPVYTPWHVPQDWERLNPGRKRLPAMFCAPRVESGPALEAIRRRLDEVDCEVGQAA